MPKKYIPKARAYTDNDLKTAVEQILDKKITLRQAARTYNIDKSKLSRYLNKKNQSKQGRKKCLTTEEEKDLTEKINIMAKWGFALSKQDIQLTVQTYVKENNIKTPFKDDKPGDDWFRLFCQRNRLSQKKMEQLEKCRRTATSDPFIIYSFYDKLQETLTNVELINKPDHIYNLDETSFNLDPGRVKGVSSKGQKVHRSIEGSGKENITTMACISASGKLLPPLIIYQGQNLWSTWKGKKDLPNTCYAASDKGWMTTAIFNNWFMKFCEMVTERPLLILMDGHVSHLDKGTIEYAIENHITLLKLPPHTTDLLQPLDKCCFGPLKLKWNKKLIEWQRLNQRKLTKSEFADMICELWNDGITPEVIKKSFESTGIYPCSKEKYPKERLNQLKLEKYNNTPINAFSLDISDDNMNYQEISDSELHQSLVEKPQQSNEESTTLHPTLEEIAPSDQSTSVNFEDILLKKINKTCSEKKTRRKIQSNCEVLTSSEYLKKIKEKETPVKKKKAKKVLKSQKNSSSESDVDVRVDDESDCEDFVEEDLRAAESDKENEENITSMVTFGDYALVKFNTKKKQLHYVAKVESIEDEEYNVIFLRKKGNKFVYPAIPEKYCIPKTDVVLKLPAPKTYGETTRTAHQYYFEINFESYNVN